MEKTAAEVASSISIHAPREGSDNLQSAFMRCTSGFLSTLPVRGATQGIDVTLYKLDISIHAPREGSDGSRKFAAPLEITISIHAPREGSDTAAGRCARLPAYFYPRSP